MFVTLTMLFHDHLPLGKITNHNGSFNQFVGDQMTRLVQRVLLLVALVPGFARNPLTPPVVRSRKVVLLQERF